MGLPSTEYAKYIASSEWKRKRELVLIRDNYACRCCEETQGLQVHHRHYRNLGCEELDDLTTLCQRCHDAITNVQRGDKWSTKFSTISVEITKEVIRARYEFSENDSETNGGCADLDAQWTNGRSSQSTNTRYERDFLETQEG